MRMSLYICRYRGSKMFSTCVDPGVYLHLQRMVGRPCGGERESRLRRLRRPIARVARTPEPRATFPRGKSGSTIESGRDCSRSGRAGLSGGSHRISSDEWVSESMRSDARPLPTKARRATGVIRRGTYALHDAQRTATATRRRRNTMIRRADRPAWPRIKDQEPARTSWPRICAGHELARPRTANWLPPGGAAGAGSAPVLVL